MRLMLSLGQIVILLSMYSTQIKDHFDTKISLIPFSIPIRTRRFSNNESRLLSRSHTFAIMVILDLTLYLLMWRWYVRIYPRIIMSKSHENTLLTIFHKNLSQKVNNLKWHLDDLWPHICWCLMCDSIYPRIIVSNSHGNTSQYGWLFFKNLTIRSMTPRWPLTPTSVQVTCVTLPKDHCIQVPWKYIKVCGYSDYFSKPDFDKQFNETQ